MTPTADPNEDITLHVKCFLAASFIVAPAWELYTLLGRARAQIPFPVRLKPMHAERVAEEVEAFLSGIYQRSFSLVECQPKLGHHRLRPRCSGRHLAGRVTSSGTYALPAPIGWKPAERC